MKHRISKAAIIKRFGKPASLWTDIVATNKNDTAEKYHLTAILRFDKNGRARWSRHIEQLA